MPDAADAQDGAQEEVDEEIDDSRRLWYVQKSSLQAVAEKLEQQSEVTAADIEGLMLGTKVSDEVVVAALDVRAFPSSFNAEERDKLGTTRVAELFLAARELASDCQEVTASVARARLARWHAWRTSPEWQDEVDENGWDEDSQSGVWDDHGWEEGEADDVVSGDDCEEDTVAEGEPAPKRPRREEAGDNVQGPAEDVSDAAPPANGDALEETGATPARTKKLVSLRSKQQVEEDRHRE